MEKELEQTGKVLPEGWQSIKLEKLATIVRGSSPRPKGDSRYYGGNIPRLMVADVTRDGMYITPKIDFLTEEGAKLSRPMKKDDVIMVVSGAPGLPGILAVDACIHDGFVGFKDLDNNKIINIFLFYFLKYINAITDAQAAGAIFRNLTTDQIKNFDVNIPPLAEQKRIVAILNEKMAAIEKARTATLAQIKAAKALPAAYLRQVFDSPEAQTWEHKTIGTIAKIQSGYAFKSEWFTSNGIRLLRNANIFQGFISWEDTVYIPHDKKELFSSFELFENDILLSLDRPLVNNGLKIARLSKSDIPSLLLQRVARFQLSSVINSDYLYAFLVSPKFIESISGHDQSIGVPHISPKQVEAITIPIPSFKKQEIIAINLWKKIKETKKVYQYLEEQLEAINALPAAILKQAFNGEL